MARTPPRDREAINELRFARHKLQEEKAPLQIRIAEINHDLAPIEFLIRFRGNREHAHQAIDDVYEKYYMGQI